MFSYSKDELIHSYMEYPQGKGINLKGIMPFVIASAYPLLNEKERQQLDFFKQQYDKNFQQLPKSLHKKKTAMICIELLYQAIDLYDHSFDRLADSYFQEICN